MTGPFRVASLPGDGIGPEVVAEGLRVLDTVAELDGIDLEVVHLPHGADHYLETGELATPELYEQLAACDALYLGAIGDPRVEPRVLEAGILLAITRRFQMDISVRPYRLSSERLTPLKGRQPGDIDLVVVRECAEDLFAVPAGAIHPGTEHEVQVGGIAFSRRMIERVTRYGFELARTRRRKLVMVEHSNAAPSHDIWRTTLERLVDEYDDVESWRMAPDGFAMSLISEPDQFDVVVSTWMLGGIFSDMAAALVGGLGLSGSARLSSTGGPSMFEPIHGSAPKHAGKQTASPLAAIHSLELLLEHHGFDRSARRIAAAIAHVLASGEVPTASTRSGVPTRAQGDLVLAHIETHASDET
jgi:3-isopropylmalate dehydrogenase